MSTNYANVTDYCNALDAHAKAIETHWDAAFHGARPVGYSPGSIVWLYDHYNTAEVVGMLPSGDVLVRMHGDHGQVDQVVEYKPEWVRPSSHGEWVFRCDPN
jgi:hypothetical protein